MFKQRCSKCEAKISKDYSFCPFCGKNLKSKNDSEDFGILGRNDFSESNHPGMLGGSLIDKMMNSAMKMIEKQMRDLPKEMANQKSNLPNQNMKIRFMVNGKEIPLNQTNKQTDQKLEKIQPLSSQITEEKAKKLAKLPRKEPKTIMKRLAGKLVYELSVPGVNNTQDILINQLENSIEIKAIAKNKVYSKTLNINLSLLRYKLIKGLLILEFQAK